MPGAMPPPLIIQNFILLLLVAIYLGFCDEYSREMQHYIYIENDLGH
jgi:hypothetical protein